MSCSGTPTGSGSKASCQKGLGSRYVSGRSRNWLKSKNPNSGSEAGSGGRVGVMKPPGRRAEAALFVLAFGLNLLLLLG